MSSSLYDIERIEKQNVFIKGMLLGFILGFILYFTYIGLEARLLGSDPSEEPEHAGAETPLSNN